LDPYLIGNSYPENTIFCTYLNHGVAISITGIQDNGDTWLSIQLKIFIYSFLRIMWGWHLLVSNDYTKGRTKWRLMETLKELSEMGQIYRWEPCLWSLLIVVRVLISQRYRENAIEKKYFHLEVRLPFYFTSWFLTPKHNSMSCFPAAISDWFIFLYIFFLASTQDSCSTLRIGIPIYCYCYSFCLTFFAYKVRVTFIFMTAYV
jgi:hypothetical protein